MCKVDQLKAFDPVSRDYLISVLKKFGFENMFINWIRILYNRIGRAVNAMSISLRISM